MPSRYRTSRRRLLACLSMLAPAALAAQSLPPPNTAPAELTGLTPDGQTIKLSALRERVVMVFYWSTECAVCLNKMSELRANVAGWRGEAFTLLGVNLDENLDSFTHYEKLLEPLVSTELRFPSVWGRDPAYRDNLGGVTHLPTTILLDKQGQVVERYPGRIPPAAWNRIADLL
ncbi:MAG: TlpA disulfide reductase family protein [Burkholderiaceae bacterium]